MRLIDADTAEKKLAELVEIYEKRMPKWSPNDMLTSGRDIALKHGYKADGVEKALETIKDMPTVEAEPVKHGMWKAEVICSKCGFIRQKTRSGNLMVGRYCPNCGAKMDGDTNDET